MLNLVLPESVISPWFSVLVITKGELKSSSGHLLKPCINLRIISYGKICKEEL